MNIGLDLDNTIIDYSESFSFHAKKMSLISKNCLYQKKELKELIIKQNGQYAWQKLQGIVYGKGLKQAKLFPGAYRFLWRARQRNHKIYIVSHKTLYGHYDKSKTNLREKAILFLKQKKLFGLLKNNIIDEVFFCNNQNLKINKIKELDINIFIDDLPEIISKLNFLTHPNKILFDPLYQDINSSFELANTFEELSEKIYVDWSILDFQNQHFFKYKLSKMEEISGRGNSKVLFCETITKKKISIKIYPNDNKHNRIKSEYDGLSEIYKKNKNVIKPVWKNRKANICAYQWIDGEKIINPNSSDIKLALKFASHLYKRKNEKYFKNFPKASSSCISGYEIEKQIQFRFNQLLEVNNIDLKYFLNNSFLTTSKFLIKRAKLMLNEEHYFEKLKKNDLTLSPSDFGFHNAIKQKNDNLIFLDFEYFGWDDPLKLISDFFFHPGNNLSDYNKKIWLKNSVKIYDVKVIKRLPALLPLYGLCWSLILLNEFREEIWVNRIQANKKNKNKRDFILKKQLFDSESLLKYIKNFIKTL